MTDAEMAFAAAEVEIAQAVAAGKTDLDLSSAEFRALEEVPETITALTNLQQLSLGNTRVTDLTPIAALTNLQVLYLDDTQVTNLTPIAALSNLQTLYLNYTQVTDLTPIAALSNLQTLNLSDTQVTDLTPIAALSNLQLLYLDGTQVTDLTPIAALSNLQSLSLTNTQVTDLAPVSELPKLSTVFFNATAIEDLRPLLTCPSLATYDGREIRFKDTEAARRDPELARLVEIKDNTERTDQTLAYLRTLPKWPAPLWTQTSTSISSHADQRPVANSAPAKDVNGTLSTGQVTLARARHVLRNDFHSIQDGCVFVVDQINTALADEIPAKPNTPEALRNWEHLVATLEYARAAMIEIQGALPETPQAEAISDEAAGRLQRAFRGAIETLQKSSKYIDDMDGETGHGRSYAGLLKIGVCTALAMPIGLIAGAPSAVVGAGLYAMLYGKGEALKIYDAVKGNSGSE